MTDHLKICNLPCRTQYICDGERTAFDFTFAVFEPEDIEVWINGAAISQGFAVQGVRETDGGRVVFRAPPAAGSRLTLLRQLVIARETDFQHGGILRSDALNDELDRVVAMLQQVDGETARAVRLQVSDDDAELRLPVKANRAGQVLAFDADGNLTTLTSQLSASAGGPNLDAIPEGVVNKHLTATEKQKLADLSPAAGNANPSQVTPAEKQAASETALRSFSPRDVADIARNNASAGSVTSVFGRTGTVTAAAGDYRCDQIADAGGKVMMLAAERNKLAQLRSVRDFGAVGDGIADDAAAISAAINAMPPAGGRLYFPAGVYRIGSTVTLSKPGVYYGDGKATVIRTASVSTDAFAVNAEQVIITDMSWDLVAPRTAGAYVAVRAPANRFRLQRFVMLGAFIGVHVEPGFGATATIAEGQILNTVAGSGVCILVNGGFDISITDILVDSSSNCSAGIQINNAGDVEISRGQIIHCNYGLLVKALPNTTIASVWANNSFFDNCGVAARLYAEGGAIVRSLFNQCWFSSASASHGVSLGTASGGRIDGVDINACHVFLNTIDGVNIADAGVRNVRITNGSFAQNGASGVSVIGGASEFAVIGTRIGNTHGLNGNRYGIFIGSALSANYILTNNDLRGNTTTAIADAGSGAKVVSSNLGA